MKYKTPFFFRNTAAASQNWRCFYCGLPMGGRGSPYAEAVPMENKRLLVSAEHLQARQDGGEDSKINIAAAHTICNWRRHRSKIPKTPLKFIAYVRSRIEKNRWFGSNDLKLLIEAHVARPRHPKGWRGRQ